MSNKQQATSKWTITITNKLMKKIGFQAFDLYIHELAHYICVN